MFSENDDSRWRSVETENPFAMNDSTSLLEGAFITFMKSFLDGPENDPVPSVSVTYFESPEFRYIESNVNDSFSIHQRSREVHNVVD